MATRNTAAGLGLRTCPPGERRTSVHEPGNTVDEGALPDVHVGTHVLVDFSHRLPQDPRFDHSLIPSIVESCLGCFACIQEWWNQDDYVKHACCLLMASQLFSEHGKDAVLEYLADFASTRPSGCDLWIVYAVMLSAGRAARAVLLNLKGKGIFRKLKQEIEDDARDTSGFQCTAVQLLYEVCRVQILDISELDMIDRQFIGHLMDLVERTRSRRDETFNYSVIYLLLAFNEQFMLAKQSNTLETSGADRSSLSAKRMPSPSDLSPIGNRPQWVEGNRVLVVLEERVNCSKTFSENLVFLLNRAQDQITQILILKLLYLIFTTPGTTSYFYTNDLRVIIDVILRQLNDLPEERHNLRHNYLRVLQYLLTSSQYGDSLCGYKASEMERTLRNLAVHAADDTHEQRKKVNETTLRLIDRILQECPFLGGR